MGIHVENFHVTSDPMFSDCPGRLTNYSEKRERSNFSAGAGFGFVLPALPL
jgi:hypothetical protein